jgi:hypothetical protein
VKQGNLINLYYLNLLGIVMLRPYEVNLDRGNKVASRTVTFDTLPLDYF